MRTVNYHQLCNLIDDALPGRGIWAQSASDPDEVHQEGLAIRQVFSDPIFINGQGQGQGRGHHYVVCYFRVVPEEEQIDQYGEVIDPDDPDTWRVEIGYQNEVDAPEEAHAEALDLVRYLPRPIFIKDDESQRRIFDTTIKSFLADAEADARTRRKA